MDKIRDMIRYNFRVILYLSILLLVFQNDNALAKSTNKNDFLNLLQNNITFPLKSIHNKKQDNTITKQEDLCKVKKPTTSH